MRALRPRGARSPVATRTTRGLPRRLLVVVQWAALAVAAAACGAEGELPQNALDPAGPVARQQDSLWNLVFLIATGVFILVQGLILLAVFRFRDRGDATPPKQVHGNTRLEVMWTVVPALILAAIEDALRPLGVKIDALPVTPARLRTLIREAEARQPAAAE